MATVSLRNLVKAYGKTEVLHAISLDVADGEFVVFVGPSGCGKSTTLRMIAGLEEVSAGEIWIGDRAVNHLEPKDRNIAMVFQNYAIYPHMTVRKNIGFGLRTSKLSKPDRNRRIDEVAAILSMTDYLERKPAQLSGGQRQRVAIGRAMVRDPAVFLFDEPLSNLDAQLRTQMRLEIKKLHQRVGTTVIFVTHDQVEAMTMADRIVIMKDGSIQQVGTPAEVFHQPANIFVAQFIGAPSMNMLPARYAGGQISVAGQSIKATLPLPDGSDLTVGIRPDDLLVSAEPALFAGIVSVLEPLGSETLAHIDIGGRDLIATADGRSPPAVGARVHLAADTANLHFFAPTGEAVR
ncbi:ABC transporter ATP-binding protein [Phaeovulum sp.]|jgi:multiple sugar transport system ATP-binding protein|uniref:ABC transporter ATP-binding protein n=1 Tax=Phaeovulum sp. TaxID=2934796 RepID=UPI002730C432|nr:sn-glycerol-3-phosphate ABC transporter ATP-binding protein UgpC [Phaeovulum sp.]MDP1670244.1 sn-glycerol-3-phosphate ABC transporter ATP-binding protein UgpC [Phaeovulum sp.]MDP2062850.1 sn-glycerol-3-phosphate ABC transporter ATP-binding protein UgpC [Phaeovulum sp.]MDP3860703.1 sn-glycerol-3-phosphate ABC transporter ATP-binding protein UgpC [Phaeovulum sp.]MDZ4120260.1 sn-glycerol-3-phosphate ABC transporter ATP-binding protein UgpC [Phaeovulum sp.]